MMDATGSPFYISNEFVIKRKVILKILDLRKKEKRKVLCVVV
jgi:hypothetical protein